MKPFTFASIRVDVTIDNGYGLNEKGCDRLSDAIAEILDNGNLTDAVWTVLRDELPEDMRDILTLHAKEIPSAGRPS